MRKNPRVPPAPGGDPRCRSALSELDWSTTGFRASQAPQLPPDTGPSKTLWFMAIASDEVTTPCRGLSDCPRAVQRALDMHEEYAAYGASSSFPLCLLRTPPCGCVQQATSS